MTLRLGIIGMSEGNGHPFSWSAICNGYNSDEMARCGFPVIPAYLAAQDWPAARLDQVAVTHVWTQELELSRQIARCSLIEHVVSHPEQMIGKIDGVLLARDDAENHLRFAASFLEAGLPVYIDKPIALNLKSLKKLYWLEKVPGLIFSCSALRHASELQPTDEQLTSLGQLKLIMATTPKDWERYAIHLIDPVLRIVGHDKAVARLFGGQLPDGGGSLTVSFENGPLVILTALGRSTPGGIVLHLYGESGEMHLPFEDSFGAFRAALAAFRDHILSGCPNYGKPFNHRAVEILEMGLC